MIGRSAIDFDIMKARARRNEALEESANREREYTALRRQSVMAWLKYGGDSMQEDELDTQLSRCHPNTCDWLLENPKTSSWLRSNGAHKILWLKGKPGSGMTYQPVDNTAVRAYY